MGNSSLTLGDSGLETSQGTTERLSLMQVLASPNLERILQRPEQEQQLDRPGVSQTTAETQTPPQSSQNLIADLIAKKRAHLVKRAKKRASKSESDPKIVNKIIQSARRVIRSDSGSSSQSGTSQETETDITPVSSPVLDWASASSPLSELAPSSSSPARSSASASASASAVLDSLRRKRIKLLTNQSDTESDNEEEDSSKSVPADLVEAGQSPESTTVVSNPISCTLGSPSTGPASCQGGPAVPASSSEGVGRNEAVMISLSSLNNVCQTEFKKTIKKEGRNLRKRSLEEADSDT